MRKIELEHGYFIEIDHFNHILKQCYIGKGKDKQPKAMVRTCGYYENMTRAVAEYIKCACMDATEDFKGTLMQFAEEIDSVAYNAVESLKEKLRG